MAGPFSLDELGELPMATQAKLLRVLQDGIVEPVGAEKGRQVDVRVVAATNRDIAEAIRKGEFREDLYYRLCIGEIPLPPLRERRSDIPKLALHLLDRVNATMRHQKRLSQDALARLQTHSWPGNARDLGNVIERSARLCRGDVLNADDLLITEPVAHPDPLDALPEPQPGFSMEHFLSGPPQTQLDSSRHARPARRGRRAKASARPWTTTSPLGSVHLDANGNTTNGNDFKLFAMGGGGLEFSALNSGIVVGMQVSMHREATFAADSPSGYTTTLICTHAAAQRFPYASGTTVAWSADGDR